MAIGFATPSLRTGQAGLGLAANLMPAYPAPRAGGENQASGCSLTSLVWRLRRLARLVKTEATQVRSVGLCPALQQTHASTHTGQGIGRRACQANSQDGSATGSPEVLCVFLTRDGRGLCPEGRKSQRGRQGQKPPLSSGGACHARSSPADSVVSTLSFRGTTTKAVDCEAPRMGLLHLNLSGAL